MKKKLVVAIGVMGACLLTVGCGNRTVMDLTYTFDKAIVSLPNGTVVEGKVQNWTDYDNSDQIQVKINNKTYLVHSSNIVLIAE